MKAPARYLLDSTPMNVSFTYPGQNAAHQIVNAINTNLRTTVHISKTDITNGNELPGAELTITDSDGNEVEKWTSSDVPHTIRGLELEKPCTHHADLLRKVAGLCNKANQLAHVANATGYADQTSVEEMTRIARQVWEEVKENW